MDEGSAGEEAQRTAADLEKVLRELRSREERLADLEKRCAEMELKLREWSLERVVKLGDVRQVRMAEQFRGKIGADFERLSAARSEARDDVERARERKRMLEQELETLDQVEGMK